MASITQKERSIAVIMQRRRTERMNTWRVQNVYTSKWKKTPTY